MIQRFLSRCPAAALALLLAASVAAAQPPVGSTGSPPTTPMTGPTAGGVTLGGFSLLSSDQDAMLVAAAVSMVEQLAEVVPLSTEDQLFLVFILYEFEKLSAMGNLLSGSGTTTPGGP